MKIDDFMNTLVGGCPTKGLNKLEVCIVCGCVCVCVCVRARAHVCVSISYAIIM